jgi:hypothetical protein
METNSKGLGLLVLAKTPKGDALTKETYTNQAKKPYGTKHRDSQKRQQPQNLMKKNRQKRATNVARYVNNYQVKTTKVPFLQKTHSKTKLSS